MIDLRQYLKENYNFLNYPVPELTVGFFEIKRVFMSLDDFTPVIYFDTDVGLYQTKSRVLVKLFNGFIGSIINSIIDEGETVKVEVVNQRSVRGYMSLGFRLI